MTEPKNVSPEQRVREYPDESLTVSSGFLFCRACRERLSLKSSSLKNHINARLLCPFKVHHLKPKATDVDSLSSFPFIQNLSGLKESLATYLAKAEGVDSTIDVLQWWKESAKGIPAWAEAAKKVLVVQPSSGAAERVFSILNNTFSDQQDKALQDYIETSVILRYNYNK